MAKKIMIMAGGTGGHVFPGLALAEALQAEGVEVCWLGTLNGMEKKWVEAANIPFSAISIQGLRGKGLLGWLKAPLNILRAKWQAQRLMQQQQPDLVLGMGGFVCGPGGLAAMAQAIPVVIHEQNAIAGLTNKILARWAQKVIVAFPQSILQGPNVMPLGNPVRAGLESIALVQPKKPRRLLVLGGSRGALALNQMLPKALALMPEGQRPQVLHQAGQQTLEQAKQAYEQAGIKAEVVPFIEDMVEAYQKADLVVCRAGALTVSELMAAARPAILVPFPFAVDDHQTANAQVLVDMGGAQLMPQSEMTAEGLAKALQAKLDAVWLFNASKAIRAQAPQEAKQKIVAQLLALLSQEQKP